MKNNKGFTTVEVLICFIVVSIVMMSLFSIVSAFNEKRILESYRARVYEYKNDLTNTIQEDFIKKGLTNATITTTGSTNTPEGLEYKVDCELKDGSKRQLIVYQRYTRASNHPTGTAFADDEFYIMYGDPAEELIREDFPNLGEVRGCYDEATNTFVKKKESEASQCIDGNLHVQKDLQINNVDIKITNEADPNADNRVLSIYIGLYHPDLSTKYGINIVAPINYQASNANTVANFKTAIDCSSKEGICETN